MTQRISIICVCVGLLLIWACARPEPAVNRNMPTDQSPITAPPLSGGNDPLANANANLANLNANAAMSVNANNASVITELQDSRITSTNDNLGNRTETRDFRAHPRLSKVVVYTPVKGAKEARVYGNRGEVRPLPVKLVVNALILSGDELADAVGIAMDKSPKKNAPPAAEGPPLPPLPPLPPPAVKSPPARPSPDGSAKPQPEPTDLPD